MENPNTLLARFMICLRETTALVRQAVLLSRIDRSLDKAMYHWTEADVHKAKADALIKKYNFIFPEDKIEGADK